MKKFFLKSFTISFAVLMAFFAVSCQFGIGKAHKHIYDQTVSTSNYRIRSADCVGAAEYYYSCACGERGSETFKVGEPREHEVSISVSEDYKKEYQQGEAFDVASLNVLKVCTKCTYEEELTEKDCAVAPLILKVEDTYVTLNVAGLVNIRLTVNVSESTAEDEE